MNLQRVAAKIASACESAAAIKHLPSVEGSKVKDLSNYTSAHPEKHEIYLEGAPCTLGILGMIITRLQL